MEDFVTYVWVLFAVCLVIGIGMGTKIEAFKWRRSAARSEHVHSGEDLYEVKRVAEVKEDED